MINMPNYRRIASLLGMLLTAPLTHAGGYVTGMDVLSPSFSIWGNSFDVSYVPPTTFDIAPTFNNALFNDAFTSAKANNDWWQTPHTGDPVSTVTGNNFHDETDIIIKGRAGLKYAFTRTYNSAPTATKVDKGLGFGWVHSYGMQLKSNDFGDCPNCTTAQAVVNGNGKTSSITYTDERGGDHNYLVNETTFAVTPPQGEFDSLALDTPTTGQHTLTFRNGTKYLFETVGTGTLKTTPELNARLKQIADPWGNQLNFTYDGSGRLSTVIDNLGISGRTGLVFTYDASGHLSQIADWSGRFWKYSVDASGNLLSYTDPLAQIHPYTYTPNTHNLITVAKPLARNGSTVKTTFAYYQNGRTFNYYDALNNTETLDYDLFRKSTRVTDPRGGVRVYEYDASGRLTKLTEPDGAILMFGNSIDGLRNTKTDGLGYITQYSYRSDKTIGTASDTYGNVTREQDALGQTVDTTYGPYDQVATVKDKRNNTLTTSFHASSDSTCKLAGKPDTVTLSQLTPATGSAVTSVKLASYCWNSDGTIKSQIAYLDPANAAKIRTTTYTYDTTAHLNVQSVTATGSDASTVTQSFTYDNLGQQKTATLNRRTSPTVAVTIALTTSTSYDSLGRATKVTDALGNSLETVYDANGKVYWMIGSYKQPDASIVTRILSTRTYDAADRLIADMDVLNDTTQYQYDAANNVIAITDAENHTTRYEYDTMNRRTAVIDPNGYRTTTVYDLAGHPISVTNGNNETTGFIYDKIGRLTQVTDPLGFITKTSYDANNNPTCVIDANAQVNPLLKNADGCTVSTVYDELNRPIQVKDALNNLTKSSYDLPGNVLSITDASSKTTSYAYDGLGRLISATDPLSKTTLYTRDEAGNAYQTTNRLNQISQTTFDVLNRPTLTTYVTDASTETFGYDSFGNPQSTANGTLGYSFTYDNKNRLKTKTDSRSGKSLTFTYDKVGNVLTKTDYQGDITKYTYDSANQRTAMRNSAYLSASYQHDGAGRILARLLSDGAQTQYTWNTSQLAGIRTITANGTQLNSTTYTRDRVGNVLTQVDASGTTTYAYDANYQLQSADYPGTENDESYVYDTVGNRSTQTLNGQVHAYEFWPNSNRLKAIHTTNLSGAIEKSFVYDDEGRLTSETGSGAKTLVWDQKNRAKQITAGVNTNNFNYDPMNYRIGRTGGTLGNRDYYLEGEHLEAEYSGSNLQAKYFRGLSTDELVAGYSFDASANWVPSIYHHDNLMSVTGISTNDGVAVQTNSFSAFGDRTVTATGRSKNRLTYTGREMDADSGLYYYRARYYDPSIGRFISEDPLGFSQGPNFYAYVHNNPVNGNDPSGMCGPCLQFISQAGIQLAKFGWQETSIFAAKATAGFVMGYEGAKLTGTQSELGRIGAGLVGAFGLGGSTQIIGKVAGATGLTETGSTVLASGGFGSFAEFVGQYGDKQESMLPGGYNWTKIGLMGPATAAISVLGGEASLAYLSESSRFAGWTAAAAETLGALHTSLGSIVGAQILESISPSTTMPQTGGFGNAPNMNTSTVGGFRLYPSITNFDQLKSVYGKP